jgi:ABC-2 type transport system ATP-binding protein
MKQRLAIAATLLGQPEVLVLDEPTNGVDAQGIFEIRSIITNYAAQGGTVLLASHMLDEVEKVCTHVAFLKAGEVLKTGAIGAVLATRGWVEVAAADLTALERAVREAAPGVDITRQDAARLELRGLELSPAALNAKLAAKGVYLSLLVERQISLETQYLELLSKGVRS